MKRYYLNLLLTAGLLLGVSGAAGAASVSLAQMTPAQKAAGQKYFRAHSLGFSSIFKRYHPGPYWILHHGQAFNLTPAQTQREISLKDAMARTTLADNKALMLAYKKYQADAATADPSGSLIMRDIDRVGRAETRLAKEMVPYHLKSYTALDARQKAIYTTLAAQ